MDFLYHLRHMGCKQQRGHGGILLLSAARPVREHFHSGRRPCLCPYRHDILLVFRGKETLIRRICRLHPSIHFQHGNLCDTGDPWQNPGLHPCSRRCPFWHPRIHIRSVCWNRYALHGREHDFHQLSVVYAFRPAPDSVL